MNRKWTRLFDKVGAPPTQTRRVNQDEAETLNWYHFKRGTFAPAANRDRKEFDEWGTIETEDPDNDYGE